MDTVCFKLEYLRLISMKFLSTQYDAYSWMSLFAAIILCAGISGELKSNRLVLASEQSVQISSQAPTYIRRRQRPTTGHRRFWPARGYPGFGVGALRHTPWYPGGFYYPSVQGSWYQRPYPQHFDIFRGQPTHMEEIVPDTVH
jgi:hypothetical protein